MAQFAARELGRSSVAGSDVGWAGEAGDFDVAWGLVVSLNGGLIRAQPHDDLADESVDGASEGSSSASIDGYVWPTTRRQPGAAMARMARPEARTMNAGGSSSVRGSGQSQRP